MKFIAIPVQEEKGLESALSTNYKDTTHYLMVQVENKEIKSVETKPAPTKECCRWHCKCAETLKETKVDILFVSKLGKTALNLLQSKGVEVVFPEGKTAEEAVKAYLDGKWKVPEVNEQCPSSHEGMFTIAAHAGGGDSATGSVMPPIYQTSTFSFKNADQGANRFAGKEGGYIYTRMGNPTIKALEDSIAYMEDGWGGLATASGMAAVNVVFMGLLGQGAHMVGTNSVYGPSRVVVEKYYSQYGVEYSFVDTSNLEELEKAMKENTKLVYIETPANPTISITDIQGAAEIAHKHGALLAVDNTFMSPILQRPLELGADIVLHSMTKFINGHSDIVAGIVIPKTQELYEKLYKTLIYFGGTMDPHQAYLVIRGIKTLALRVEKSQENAKKVAAYLENHPKVEWVKYPGLKSHPKYELAQKQMHGPGSLISFQVKGGQEAGKTIMNTVHIATLAVSLGGIESLIQHPASMTHAAMAPEDREKAGITGGLVRLSVGCENYEDIRADLDHALAKI